MYHFVGYDASDNFWLVEVELANAKKILAEYWSFHGL